MKNIYMLSCQEYLGYFEGCLNDYTADEKVSIKS